MSSPSYVYIPNLVGRQMLRIPVADEVEHNKETQAPATERTLAHVTTPKSTFSSRESSPAISITVESVDELE